VPEAWSARPVALLDAALLILSFWISVSPFYVALSVWMATVGSTFGEGMVFYREEAAYSVAFLILYLSLLVEPWLNLTRGPVPLRKWTFGFITCLSALTALEVKLLFRTNFNPKSLDP